MTRIYVDIETYSSVDLKKSNVYRYVEAPDFTILMAAWAEDDGPVWLDTDQDVIVQRLRDYWDAGDELVFVAHNTGFERVCFSAAMGMPVGEYLPPERFHDTQAVAGEYGYPQKLDPLAKALKVSEKDGAGTRLINIFSKPNRKGTRTMPEEKPQDWQAFKDYCIQDVVTLQQVDKALGDFPTEAERQASYVDQRINDRGFRIDTDLARHAMDAAADNHMEQELRFMYLTGVTNPNSQPQVLKWCQQAVSPKIKNLKKETVEHLLTLRLSPVQREVLELRQELALVASKKYGSALTAVNSDGRLRGTLAFFGAHTGRWAGRGTQVHNLPREAFTWVNPETDKKEHDFAGEQAAILDLAMGLGGSATNLKRLVRALFQVDGAVVDYAAIEARVVAWLAGEQWALQAFREGRDIYVETAERMSTPDNPLDRSQGKVAVLALGYQGGPNSLRAMGAEGTDDDLRPLVTQWRNANPSIVRLWHIMSDAIENGGPVGPHMRVTHHGRTMKIHLPSGRAIHYHGLKWERYRYLDEATNTWKVKEGWRYDNPKRAGARIGTYGGRLVENVTQAVARDLLAHALVNLERAGFRTVAHVHDEIIVENTTDVAEVSRIMCDTPAWAKGLPVDGEGFFTERYRKG